jgi:uncharacterized glyoxalase superfamily protein PhnB
MTEGQPATTAARVDFNVADVDSLIPLLVEAGGEVVSPPNDSPWGSPSVSEGLLTAGGW